LTPQTLELSVLSAVHSCTETGKQEDSQDACESCMGN